MEFPSTVLNIDIPPPGGKGGYSFSPNERSIPFVALGWMPKFKPYDLRLFSLIISGIENVGLSSGLAALPICTARITTAVKIKTNLKHVPKYFIKISFQEIVE
jgi:hypothetical protein